MTREIPESHPLHRMFRGLAESTFMDELGIGDPNLVGYVAGLLARFVPSEGVWKIRDGQGRRIGELSAMLARAESCADDRDRGECHRHVGDFALFWTGVFPEALPRLKAGNANALFDFCAQGKRSYFLASHCPNERAEVLRRLSDQFELCAFGLTRVRKEWERVEPRGGDLIA